MRKLLAVALGTAMVLALMFAGCDLDVKTETIDAATPVITGGPLPEGALSFEVSISGGSAWFDLTIAATRSDDGILSYQWYSLDAEFESINGTPVPAADGGTDAFYSGNVTEEGVYLYYVEVTNTNNNVNGQKSVTVRSEIVTILVTDPASPIGFPVIMENPGDVTGMVGTITLTATARLPDKNTADGTLTFQWFGSNTASNKDGSPLTQDPVEGTAGASGTVTSIEIDIGAAGTYYYYVVVTNNVTVTEEDDTTTMFSKSVASRPATVVVVAEMTPNATITVNTNRKYQYVRGFGGMDIPWDNFYSITEEEYESMYNPDTGLGYNMIRIMIMPENPDEEIDNTDPATTIDQYVAGARPNYIKGVQIVNGYNGYVLASPWSPPPEWKSNGTINGGGHLLTGYYGAYAKYLKDFAQAMYDRGAPIYAVSIQNEPNYIATYDGCEWEPEDMRDFFVQQGIFTEGVKGWGGGKEIPRVLTMNGESANTPSINDAALDNATSRAAIDLIGRHTYGSVQTRYAKAIDHGKEVWMTEHNINSGNEIGYPNDSTWNFVWQFMNDVDVSIRLNDESAFIWWALKRFYSFIGDGDSRGRTVEGAILPRGYGMSHYAKYASETWRCGVAVSGTLADGTTAIDANNVNNTTFNRDSTAAKVTSFVTEDGNSISLVIYTPTNTSGRNGVDLGTVRVQLPSGFTARTVTAIRSTASTKARAEEVLMSNDGTQAFIMVPPGHIVSVRFTR